MKRGKAQSGKIETTVRSFQGLKPDHHLVFARYKVGLAEFSITRIVEPQDVASVTSQVGSLPKVLNRLSWQLLNELDTDHAMGATYGVLFDPEFGALGYRPTRELEAELQDHLGVEAWERLKHSFLKGFGELDLGGDFAGKIDPAEVARYRANLRDQYRSLEDLPNWEVLLRALWADSLAEPFGPVWLAAMAQHAYYFAEDGYAFGYLTALLDQRLSNEEHFERGVHTQESAARGGEARAAELREQSAAVLSHMERLVGDGHSVRRAAELAHRAGLGASANANRQLWKRTKGQTD